MAIPVASALVSSRLDYVNSVLFGCPQKHAARLQRVQQALARVVTQQSSVSPLTSTELLKQLHSVHWLPIEWRIWFKLVCLVHKILNTGHPPYLTELYNITSLQGPRVHLPVTYSLFRDTTFHLVPSLSASPRPKYGTLYLFTSANLKHTLPSDVILRRTTFFQPILPASGPCNAPWFSSETLALYKSLTYLLTYLLIRSKLSVFRQYCCVRCDPCSFHRLQSHALVNSWSLLITRRELAKN